MCGVRPMARVFIDRDLSTKVAEWFGPQGIPVAKDLSLEKRYHGIDTDVCLDVDGRDGSNVAVEHEWGAWNVQRRHWVEGHHVMRDAARMNGGV